LMTQQAEGTQRFVEPEELLPSFSPMMRRLLREYS